MRSHILVKGRGLGGSADLTLLAPIKPGFIDSLESIAYKSRKQWVLDTLDGDRMAEHAHHTAQPSPDAVERVGAIHLTCPKR